MRPSKRLSARSFLYELPRIHTQIHSSNTPYIAREQKGSRKNCFIIDGLERMLFVLISWSPDLFKQSCGNNTISAPRMHGIEVPSIVA